MVVAIFLEELSKTTTNFTQDSLYLGRDLNPGPPKYEARMNCIKTIDENQEC
jgi:hypothetical protein